MMLQQAAPENYVIATGETNIFEYFDDYTFKKLGLNYKDH
jgi:GDP-D-mannose dehydratase